MQRLNKKIFSIITLLFFIAAPVFSEIKPDNLLFGDDDPSIPWRITADEIEYDQINKQYIGRGHVHIAKADKKLSADMARFDHKTMKVSAQGHVVIASGGDILSGSRIDADLNAGTGVVYDGSLFVKENHFFIRSERIEKIDKATYTAHKGSLTSCDGDCPDWKITGSDMKITPGSYGFVKHSALWVRDIPVAYIPFLIFPVNLKRQSGLLAPEMGHSDRKGIEYTQPFYWAIDDSSDATVYYQYMEKRGNKLGLEYRYVLNEHAKGLIMLDVLNDRQTDIGSPESVEKWGYAGDAYSRPNSDRYWFRMKHDQPLPLGFFGRVDLDIVSDQDYLNEFKDGYTGFDKTRSYFKETFNRELDDYTDPSRVNSISLSKTGMTYSLNAETRWYDNPAMRRWEETDTSLHKLPTVRFDSLRQSISGTPLYWGMDSEYSYFYRENGRKGHRMDMYPRVYLPMRYKNYLSFEPSVGMRETIWSVDNDDLNQDKNHLNREMADVKLDLSSAVSRIYAASENSSFRHKMVPQLVYEYAAINHSEDYPYFDPLDLLEKKHRITYSLTNFFTSKTARKKADSPEYDYHQVCRIKLAQSYYLNEDGQEWAANGQHDLSPVYGEIMFYPFPYFTLEADAQWSPYSNQFKSRNIAAAVSDQRGDRIVAEYRYTQDFNESLYANLTVKLTKNLLGYADYERNIYDGREIRNSIGIAYLASCWSVDVRYAREEGDRRYSFMINLYGLGGIGSGR